MRKKIEAAKEAPRPRARRQAEEKPPSKAAERERAAEAARRFKALGETTRLRIVLFLRHHSGVPGDAEAADASTTPVNGTAAGDAMAEPVRGVRVTDLCRQVTGGDKLSSTFSHHLKELRRAGLIRVEKDGKNRRCRLEQAAFDALLPFLRTAPQAAAEPEPHPEGSPSENGTGGASS